jgi:hypothetical protein
LWRARRFRFHRHFCARAEHLVGHIGNCSHFADFVDTHDVSTAEN